MKKIAVAAEEKMVTKHFGHCPYFMIFETEGEKILKVETVENPGHKPGFLPNFLNDLGVNTIISGCMGGGALDIFNDKGIDVVVGAEGLAEDAVKKYLKGELESTGVVCNEHQHKGECHDHEHGEEHHGHMHHCHDK